MKPECKPVALDTPLASAGVSGVRYQARWGEPYSGDLLVDVLLKDGSESTVCFGSPLGFRVLDERDLLEYWNDYSLPHGWLWEVVSGGWLDAESGREGFVDRDLVQGLREFFVVGDMCVNVLCAHPPTLVVE